MRAGPICLVLGAGASVSSKCPNTLQVDSIQEEGAELRVRVGIGKWGDKAAAGLVALFAGPLLAIPAFGAVK